MTQSRGCSSVLPLAILALASLLGLGAFLYPFFLPVVRQADGGAMAHAADAPLLFVVLLLLCLGAAFAAVSAQEMTSKVVALLGILTALTAALRALPGPGGFSAIFLLPILAGYCYGATFGFLLGALSLLVSALIGGGVGPWMPYQMFAMGWVGLLSGWLPHLAHHPRVERMLLAAWGGLLGFIFGAIMNLWFWPFLSGAAASGPAAGQGQVWLPGMAIWPTLRTYLAFYLATSLWWDLARAGGNILLILILGGPILRVLRRFRNRFRFQVLPEIHVTSRAQP